MNQEEKRNYKRYESRSGCEIKIGEDTYKGNLVDYSDGVGAIIDSALKLVPGMHGNIKIDDLELEIRAEVVLVKEAGQGLRIGFKSLENFKGNLRDFRISDILIGFKRGLKTGILIIESSSVTRKLFIKNGDMVSAASDDMDEQPGALLLKKGRITLDEYNQICELSDKTGQSMKDAMIKLGYIKKEEAASIIRYHYEEIILRVFDLDEGRFEFIETEVEETDICFNAAELIYKGFRRITSFDRIKKLCPPTDTVLNLSADPMNIFQDIDISEEDRKILAYINGLYPISIILTFSPLNDFETLKSICAFLSMGLVKIKDESETPFELPDMLQVEADEFPKQLIRKIDDMYGKCDSLNYYEILNIPESATPEEIKNAYYRISKRFHPDRRFSLPKDDPELKNKLIKILTCLTEAYEALSGQEKKKRYDKALVQPIPEKVTPLTEEVHKELPAVEKPPMEEVKEMPEKEPSLETPPEIEEIPPVKDRRKKTWLYLPITIILTIILAVGFAVYKIIYRAPEQPQVAVKKEPPVLPPFRQDLFDRNK